MEVKQRIEQLKENLKKAEHAKTAKETEKAAAEKQLAETVEAMAAYGVTPDTIDAEIAKLEAEINDQLTQIESLIPKV